MRILKEQTVCVVVDIQERLIPHINNHEAIITNTRKLLKGIELLDMPIIGTEQYTKGLGPTIAEIKPFFKEIEPLEKMSFSCCGNHQFLTTINTFNKRNVIIAGVESHVCVLQTAIDLIEKGFMPIVVADATSSRKEYDKQIALDRLKQEGAVVTTVESILFELCMEAGNDTFKGISKLVK